MKQKKLQRLIILLFGLAFIGSTGFILVGSIFNGEQASDSVANNGNDNSSAPEQLQAQARGYEKVLEREPKNPTALAGLVETRLKMSDLPGAIAPLETLVKMYPEQENFQALLEAIKQQVGESQLTSPGTENQN